MLWLISAARSLVT
ncbi:hypothetical protein VCCP104417_2407, partial [Vibrio cholerae CP1044(17)]